MGKRYYCGVIVTMSESEQTTSLALELQEKLEQRILLAAKENRILCSAALAIAKSLGVPPGEVGKTANKLNIRISK